MGENHPAAEVADRQVFPPGEPETRERDQPERQQFADRVKAARDRRERQRKECNDVKRDEDDAEAEAAGADS